MGGQSQAFSADLQLQLLCWANFHFLQLWSSGPLYQLNASELCAVLFGGVGLGPCVRDEGIACGALLLRLAVVLCNLSQSI